MAPKSMRCLCLFGILFGIAFSSSVVRLGTEPETSLKVCAQGFFLSEQNKCLPCNCKGHADHCEDITGICINCSDHSMGDFCEMCEDGYMLAPSKVGRHSCRPCACPLSVPSNNFAVHCDRQGDIQRCKCKEGYAGHICERCAPGYYGMPMTIGGSCKRCDCNDNSDPNLIFNWCHNVTGHCQHCWGNTGGPNCERCAQGFYGDAIGAKDCRECECSKCGTSSCDDRTGVCHCKPGVTGRLCDRCEDGYSGFSSCQGCQRCECRPASLRPTCHSLTHSCLCRPGAGGRYCERCLPGYWDYSPAGCKSCDECIWHVIGDLRLSNKTLDHLKVGVLNISTGAAVNDRVKYYNYTVHHLQNQFQGWRNKLSLVKTETGGIEDSTQDVVSLIRNLSESESTVKRLGSQVDEETLQTFMLAENFSKNLTDLNMRIEEIIHEWELYSADDEADPEVLRRNTEEALSIVSNMRNLDLSTQGPITIEESTEAHDLLRRIRQLEKKSLITHGHLTPLKLALSRFTTKLSDSQSFLQNATSTIEETQDRNRGNVLKFQRNEATKQRMATEFAAIHNSTEKAKDIINVSEENVAEVDSLVENITQYHAAIDGASQKLMEKMEKLSSADTDLMQRADEHAQELERQATKLEEDLRESDANGFVQKAISAANVYTNIVKYINDANITSLTNVNLSHTADDSVTGINMQLNDLVIKCESVFKESVSLHSEQIEVEAEVVDKLKYIEETKETLDKNTQKLEEMVQNINEIQTARTNQRLEYTLKVAEGTLNRSAVVLDTITPISNKVEEWANNLSKNKYSTAAYEQAIVSAKESVDHLHFLVPELLGKLKVVEQKKPVNNITANVMRIRELIAQARSVAKKVQVSMKFNGQSSVEIHADTNLEDLKAVTSISLFMRVDPDKDPIEDRFILYLGDRNGRKDYMGLAIKNDNLVYVYNLGGEYVEIPLSSKPVSQWPAVFNYIKVERLGRHGKIYLIIPSQRSTDEQKFIQKGESPGTDSLFDVDPKDMVFFVGGVPPDASLPPPLALAPFVGCIELASLNNDVISLYNFKNTHKMDVVASTPCSRYKLAFSQSRIASYLFDGKGYALINKIERRGKFGYVTRFDISVRTVASDGVLFIMVNADKFFLLEIKNGFLHLKYDFGFTDGPKRLDDNIPKLKINDARYHEISVIYHQSKKVILLVDKSHVKSMENPKTTLPFSDIYIGGAPSHILQSRSELSAVVGLKGCVKGFLFQKKDFNLLEEPGTIGISSGCPEESFASHKAYFMGESYLGSSAKISPFDKFEGGLNFRTSQASGLLFYHNEGPDEFSISLENGAVVMNTQGTRVKTHKKHYNDGRTHFLLASVNNQKYLLLLDDKDKQEKKRPQLITRPSSVSTVKNFYFGGSPSSSFRNFTGCITYAYINRHDRDIEPEDFQHYSENVRTFLQDCPVQKPPAALSSRPRDDKYQAKQRQSRQVSRDEPIQNVMELRSDSEVNVAPCHLSSSHQATQHAYQYSNFANSRQHYRELPESLSQRSNFSLSLKTKTSFGLIFYVSDFKEKNFMTLFLTNGRLVYTFNVGEQRVEIWSKESYNDGVWHNVIFIRDGNMGKLIIDGLTVLEDKVNGKVVSLHVSSPLYFGGVPPKRAQRNIQTNSTDSFSGCLKNIQLNGHWLSSADETFGVTPCFEGLTEAGTFFAEDGGYVLLDTLELGPRFEVEMEVRPRVTSGVLLHAPIAEGYFSIYIHKGAVLVVLTDGTHVLLATVSPRQALCAGHWHRIAVMREMDVLKLQVDHEVHSVDGSLNLHSTRTRKIFIGGDPDLSLTGSHVTNEPYVGCMRNLMINNGGVSFSDAAMVSGAVSVGSCPTV
ncbi:laminin subunit alpha-4 isoform X2 [Phyllopteryx taeniolatus]|uniref:laminin subunit alpha-4 isoform X2 n=1 Tax=Phyllopteryx taeniolatus TaxID=161469 RepID=UPI002AD40057|nr:laminin subunit alpha-4 isoform X2 [Phyllopteryx taeniolatus]